MLEDSEVAIDEETATDEELVGATDEALLVT
jgi:hypothetical protein